jgi:hypothetical protein
MRARGFSLSSARERHRGFRRGSGRGRVDRPPSGDRRAGAMKDGVVPISVDERKARLE